MAKSKYPQQLDTSIEIPPVRDNITEIGSDVINSLRSAIFNIEATLGLNPQGAIGNTVSARLNKSLDANGNILEEAFIQANILTGPIIDADVSSVAAIHESKLRLDYPTTLLQDEITILNSNLNEIILQLQELITEFSIHIAPTALNRHSAVSISVSNASIVASDIATLSLESGNVQDTFEEIYNAHINYTGNNISDLNNSHLANQIFFNNIDVSETIFSDSVQGAIEDLANIESIGFRNTLINTTSNGRIRKGSILDNFEGNNKAHILVESTSATYVQAGGNSTTTFSFTSAQPVLGSISEFDILTLSGSIVEADNIDYQISEVVLNGSGNILEAIVYGGPKGNSTSGLLITISKNPYVIYNSAGFACVSRPRSTKTNTPDIQYLNPDCATIISTNILPTSISSTSDSFDISIDGAAPITIQTFVNTLTVQTLDSIVQKINDQCIDQHLNITAFKIKSNNCYELAIAHNVPNIAGDIVNRTITISESSSNDGTTNLGFADILDIEIEGQSKNSLNLNGLILSDFGLIQEFTEDTIAITTGSLSLSLFSGTMAELGIRVGDIAVITGSTNSADDGSYRIGSILSGVADLDLVGATFSGTLDEESIVYIIRATANVDEFTFEEISTLDGTILFDIFMSEDKNIFATKRMEIEGSLQSGTFFGAISDVSKNFILAGEEATLTVNTTGYATLTDPSSQTGQAVYVGISGQYKIFSSDGLSFVILDVDASAPPLINQSITLFGFSEVSSNNYHLCRGGFSTSLGRILGTSTNPGIPTLIDKRNSGTVDHTIIGESFIEKFIEGPRNELRASGIIRGCEVVNTTYTAGSPIFQNFSVSAGIIIVNGIRREFSGIQNIRIDTDQTYIVAMDANGCIVSGEYIDDPLNPGNTISPFFETEVAYLAEVRNNGSTAVSDDLRLFIDKLDLKVLGDIKVSNDSNHGHFTDIRKAVQYSKRFRKMFPLLKPPSILIENGTYEVDRSIILDFDLTIKGSGPGTVITKTDSFAVGTALTGSNVDMDSAIFLIGDSQNDVSNELIFGVDISDFTYTTNSAITNVGCVIAITQPLVKSAVVIARRATYRFTNICFDGPATINGSVADPNKIGEFAIVIGQQDPNTLAPINSITMGNIIISNCRFNRMGLENGSVIFTESASSTFKDILVNNNIVTIGSPNVSSTTAVVIVYPTIPTVENIIETGNSFRISN